MTPGLLAVKHSKESHRSDFETFTARMCHLALSSKSKSPSPDSTRYTDSIHSGIIRIDQRHCGTRVGMGCNAVHLGMVQVEALSREPGQPSWHDRCHRNCQLALLHCCPTMLHLCGCTPWPLAQPQACSLWWVSSSPFIFQLAFTSPSLP